METEFSQSNSQFASGPENPKPDFVQTDGPIIDCDLHNRQPSHQMLYPYLPDYWCDYCEESGFPGPDANDYPDGVPTSTRPEITHPSEERPASDLALLRKHALDFWEVQYGILTCGYRVQSVHNEISQQHSLRQSTIGKLNTILTQNRVYAHHWLCQAKILNSQHKKLNV